MDYIDLDLFKFASSLFTNHYGIYTVVSNIDGGYVTPIWRAMPNRFIKNENCYINP